MVGVEIYLFWVDVKWRRMDHDHLCAKKLRSSCGDRQTMFVTPQLRVLKDFPASKDVNGRLTMFVPVFTNVSIDPAIDRPTSQGWWRSLSLLPPFSVGITSSLARYNSSCRDGFSTGESSFPDIPQ